jgi:hypothetical protein
MCLVCWWVVGGGYRSSFCCCIFCHGRLGPCLLVQVVCHYVQVQCCSCAWSLLIFGFCLHLSRVPSIRPQMSLKCLSESFDQFQPRQFAYCGCYLKRVLLLLAGRLTTATFPARKSWDRAYSLHLFRKPILTSVTCLVFDPPIDIERKRSGRKKRFITSVMGPSRTRRGTAATDPGAAGVSSEPGNKTPATPTHHLMVDGDSSLSTSAQSSSTSALSGSRRSTKNPSNDSGAPAETSASATLEANKDSNVEMDDSKAAAVKPNTRGRNGIRKMTSRVSYFKCLIMPRFIANLLESLKRYMVRGTCHAEYFRQPCRMKFTSINPIASRNCKTELLSKC